MRFVLIDRIVMLEPGKQASGFRIIPADDDYFRDHFPGYPVVPGVLVLESMAQLGGRLVQVSVREASRRDVLPMLAMVERAQFRRPIRPGDRLDVDARITNLGAARARVTASASVGGQAAASAEITYVLAGMDTAAVAIPPDAVAGIRAWDEEIWRQLTSGTGTDAPGRT
ncbi:MAG: 3-hydroxydecanoyl-(acyl-carrier-protein) dehydratase [Acidobacteria bacterium]|jgi:3-hydroxyacyl-[acyl-carrier-protein] dehydratase|nr:3-hydroxydecanoyl-(acyl-carrier-protein) dehydratase [Acidobacteriota bacterium]